MNKDKNRIIENLSESDKEDFLLDFTTSSSISRVNIKILAIYIPIFWLSGMLVAIYWYEYTKYVTNWIPTILFLPVAILCMYFIFIFGCIFFSKLFLTLINLVHKPKEGIFKAEKGNPDFEFWCLRIELKKLILWLIRNCPLPWLDILAFKLFGVKMDSTSHLNDAWADPEFIELNRKSLVGQGAVVMSSMVVGKYLIIKKVRLSDYCIVGGQSIISPGTIIGKDSVIGALSMSKYNQVLEDGWIYTGIPAFKFKKNKYAETGREVLRKIIVDDKIEHRLNHKINIEEDKKDLV
ncbi:MAG: hypothetical protein GF353_16320 [Candidatus Lokiarchaeota archaeon]|nr:hypothetical protein [Candidatus Lokiarchaeota archaeon]